MLYLPGTRQVKNDLEPLRLVTTGFIRNNYNLNSATNVLISFQGSPWSYFSI